jgi:predicted nucleic acid-binding protein
MPARPTNIQVLPGKRLYAKALLIDTSALLALSKSKDIHHLAASDCLKSITEHRLPVFISIPTIYEAQRRILFDLGQQVANQFLDQIYDGSLNIERTVNEDEQEARALVKKYTALKLTLTDAANMAVMMRLGIAMVFSFDRHFLQAGFIRIPPY